MTTHLPSLAAGAPVSRAHRPSGTGGIVATVRSFLMLLGLDIRRSQGHWILPLMVGLGIYAPPTDHLPEIVLWPEMSHATLQAYVVVAPLAAALAAWLVDRERRRRMRAFTASLPGSGLGRDLLALAVASFWGLAGYLGVAAWFCGQALLRATWGGPDVGLMATGMIAVVAFAAIGVLVGSLVPGKFSPLLALTVTFFVTVGADLFPTTYQDGSTRNPIQLLMPFGLTRVSYPSVFYRENDGFVGPVALWMLALVGLLIAVIAVLRSRSVGTWLALGGALGLAGAAVTPLINPNLAAGNQAWQAIAYGSDCEERHGFEVCLHPAYRSELGASANGVAAMFGPVQGLAGVPDRWSQLDPTRNDSSEQPGVIDGIGYEYGMLPSVAGLFPPADASGLFGQRPASQLVVMEWLVEQSGMGLPGSGWFGWPAEVPVITQDHGDGTMGVGPDEAALAAFQPKMDAALARFAALPEADQRAWLEENWTALRAGDMALDDLP